MKPYRYTLRLLTTAVFFFSVMLCSAQDTTALRRITGSILDSAGKFPLEMITVRLLGGDGNTIKVAVSAKDGAFVFAGLKAARYAVDIVGVGYKPRTVEASLSGTGGDLDLGAIYLDTASVRLRSVLVTANKPIIKQQIDRIVYDLQADPESKINSVLDMMRKVPYLALDGNDNILLKGNPSYKILINGKPSSLVENNPKQFLRSMPASTIQRIEVITTPPAKYDAEGLGGIINIITNRRPDEGYNGSVNLNESFPTGGPGGGATFTFRQGRFGVAAYVGGSIYKTPWTGQQISRVTSGTTPTDLLQTGAFKSNGHNAYSGTELSYEIDSLRLLSAQFNINGSGEKGDSRQHSLLSSNGVQQQQYDLTGNYRNPGTGWDASMNYQLGFKNDKSKLMTFSYRYYAYRHDRTANSFFNNKFNYDQTDYRQTDEPRASEHTVQIDYTRAIHRLNTEAGVKGILRRNKSDFENLSYDAGSGDYIIDPAASDAYTNKQYIIAAYNNYMIPVGSWEFMWGLRAEETITKADFLSSSTRVRQDYFNLIPNLAFNKHFKNGSSLNFGYNQRIKRPGISRLNPFVDRSNPNIESTGNPALKPVLINNLQTSYSISKKANLTVGLSYFFANNIDLRISVYDPNTNVTRSSFQNVGRASRLGLDYSFSYPLAKNLNFMLNGNFGNMWARGLVNDTILSVENFTWYLSASAAYRFGKGWQLTGNMTVNSKNPTDLQISVNAVTTTSFGLNKDFKGGKYSVAAAVNNPFNKYRHNITYTFGDNFRQNYDTREYFRLFKLSANYRFGRLNADIRKSRKQIRNDDVSN